jgi:hypothetical protein
MKTFPSFLSIPHSVISSQIKQRVAKRFVSALMMLTINWPILVLVYCLMASNSTSAILKHHTLPTKTFQTLTPLINTSHLLCCMPVCFWNNHLEHIGFETDLFGKLQTFVEEKLLFWFEALSLTNNVGLASAAFSVLKVWLGSGQGVSIIQLRFGEEDKQLITMIAQVSQTELEKLQVIC